MIASFARRQLVIFFWSMLWPRPCFHTCFARPLGGVVVSQHWRFRATQKAISRTGTLEYTMWTGHYVHLAARRSRLHDLVAYMALDFQPSVAGDGLSFVAMFIVLQTKSSHGTSWSPSEVFQISAKDPSDTFVKLPSLIPPKSVGVGVLLRDKTKKVWDSFFWRTDLLRWYKMRVMKEQHRQVSLAFERSQSFQGKKTPLSEEPWRLGPLQFFLGKIGWVIYYAFFFKQLLKNREQTEVSREVIRTIPIWINLLQICAHTFKNKK